VMGERGGDSGLALRDSHFRVESPAPTAQDRRSHVGGKAHHLKGLPHCRLTMSSNRGAVSARGRRNARRET
jgi:hypothetical protein